MLEGGPWTFDGRLVVLKIWFPKSCFENDRLLSVPIWIRLPWLSPQLWSTPAIMKIANMVGKPLRTCILTARQKQLSYARVFEEIEVANNLPRQIEVMLHNGGSLWQNIEYEWVPPSCEAGASDMLKLTTKRGRTLRRRKCLRILFLHMVPQDTEK